MRTVKFLSGLFILVLIFTFCKKDKVEPDPVKPTPYSVRLTDAPGPYTAVNIDLQGIELTGNGNTVMLNTVPGIYNLLNFANGVDTLIATGDLEIERVQQIRLILGPNNSLVVGGVTHSLAIPSGSESGLKLQVHQELQAGVAYGVLLDFDANQSIVEEGNGSYHLKPVIRTIETALSGSIKGKLSKPGVPASITATSGSNAYSSIPNAAGDFIIRGVPAGTYTVNVVPAAPNNSVNINSVNVTTGNTTMLGTINI
jgi:hypothetical protein